MSTWWISQSELNEEQLRVIGLPIDRHCLITGPPGSGKTNLLLLRAKYHILSGQHNVVVLTFTRTLKNFITLGGDQYGIAPNKIMTSMAFFEDLLTQHGQSFKR